MPFGVAAAAVVGAYASKEAARKQSNAAKDAAQAQQDQFQRETDLQEPFRQSGLAAQNRLLTLLGIVPQSTNGMPDVQSTSPDFGKYARDFGMQDFKQDPGYAFRLGEGLKALDRQAAARGGLISGAALKAAQNYGQEAASNEYQNAFNRYQVNRSNQLNPLQSLAGQAQSAAGVLGQAGQSMANNLGNAYTGAANAAASGYVGSANALAGGIGQYMNYQQNQQYLDMLRHNNAPSYTPSYNQMDRTNYGDTYGSP